MRVRSKTSLTGLTLSLAGLALLLAGVPAPALGWAPPDEPTDEGEQDPGEDPDMQRARELFDSGVARYTAADYGAAVDLWLEAYALIPPTYDNRLVKAELIYNVARAQQKWFEIDQDIKHLRQAREILARYLGEVDEIYPPEQVELERQKVQEQIDELDELIRETEAEIARREKELAERLRPKFDPELDRREARRNKAMIGSGAALSGLGLGGVGMIVGGVLLAAQAEREVAELPLGADADARATAIQRGRTGNVLMVGGTVIASALIVAGVPLLATGLVFEKRRRDYKESLQMSVVPTGTGLIWTGRF